MIILRSLSAPVLCAALFVSSASAQDLVLRFAPEPGTEYAFGVEQDQDMVMDLGPMGEQAMSTLTRFEMRWAALDRAENGDTRMRMHVDRMVMSLDQGDTTLMTLDTDAMDENAEEEIRELAEAMTMMMSTELIATISPLGELVEITGFEALWEKMREKLGDDPQMQQLGGVLEKGFSGENMAQQLRQTFPVFPEQSVKKGDSWSHESVSNNPMIGSIDMDMTYTVGVDKKVGDRPCRELLVTTAVEMAGDSEMVEQIKQMTGAEMEISFDDVATEGTMCIDYATGLPIGSDMGVAMAIQMGMSMNESELPEDSDVPSRIDMKISVDGTIKGELMSTKKIGS